MEFKIGDKVRLTTEAELKFPNLKGTGVIVIENPYLANIERAVHVLFDNSAKPVWLYEKRLQHITGQLLFSFMR